MFCGFILKLKELANKITFIIFVLIFFYERRKQKNKGI